MKYIIREMKEQEYPLLKDFLYEAIFQPDGANLAPKSIIEKPEIIIYIENFGKEKDDYCLCAEVEGKVVGWSWYWYRTDEEYVSSFKAGRIFKSITFSTKSKLCIKDVS